MSTCPCLVFSEGVARTHAQVETAVTADGGGTTSVERCCWFSFYQLEYFVAGVGGDTSWSRSIYPKYQVPPGSHCWTLIMRPLTGVECPPPIQLPADVLRRVAMQLERPYTAPSKLCSRLQGLAAAALLLLAIGAGYSLRSPALVGEHGTALGI